MTPSEPLHVAEQVAVSLLPEQVTKLLDGPPLDWLQTFMLLAWNEGQHHLSWPASQEPRPLTTHTPTLGRATELPDRSEGIAFGWYVRGCSNPFARLTGQLTIRPLGHGCTLELRGTHDGRPEPIGGTARTAVEVVVRAFLGHLRYAFLDSAGLTLLRPPDEAAEARGT